MVKKKEKFKFQLERKSGEDSGVQDKGEREVWDRKVVPQPSFEPQLLRTLSAKGAQMQEVETIQ